MWLSDLSIILPDRVLERGSLRIEGDTIAEIVEGSAPLDVPGRLSLPSMFAMPGIIDLHGDMLERDIEPRPSARFPVALALYELDKRCAAAGITTSYAAVSFSWTQNDIRKQESAIEIISTVNALRHELLVDFRIHARFEITNPDTASILKELLQAGQVQLVSVMDHTPGQGQYRNVDKYVDFISKWLGYDLSILGDDLVDKIKGNITVQSTTPRNWQIIREVAKVAHQYNIPVASHDDDTIEKVDMLAELGISISEFPVTEIAAQRARQHGMHIIMGAPNAYRGSSTSEGNLSARHAVQLGIADILATDYFPIAPFQAALLIADNGILPLHESVKLVSQNAADAMGMNDTGRIAAGCKADLVLFEDVSHHPRIRATLRNGHAIYWDGLMTKLARQQDFQFPTSAEPSTENVEAL